MAALSTQSVSRAGVTPSYASCAGGGDTFTPSKDTYIHIKNGHSSPQSITIVTPRTDAIGNAIADVVVSVTNAQERMIGPFPYEHFADPATGIASVTYSGVTSLTIGVFTVAQP